MRIWACPSRRPEVRIIRPSAPPAGEPAPIGPKRFVTVISAPHCTGSVCALSVHRSFTPCCYRAQGRAMAEGDDLRPARWKLLARTHEVMGGARREMRPILLRPVRSGHRPRTESGTLSESPAAHRARYQRCRPRPRNERDTRRESTATDRARCQRCRPRTTGRELYPVGATGREPRRVPTMPAPATE